MALSKRTVFRLAVMIVAAAVVYWFYFASPDPFPEETRLLEKMNETFPAGHAAEIQAVLPLDDSHVYVPFVSGGDRYGSSYWEWKLHDWKPVRIDTTGEPQIWTPNLEDPSSAYAVWNFHPEDEISKAAFYLLRDSSYIITPQSEIFVPKVQLKTAADVSGQSYCIKELPESWNLFLEPVKEIEEKRNPNTYFGFGFSEPTMRTGTILFDSEGKQTFPERSVNGKGYSNGEVILEYMHFLNKKELLTN